MFQVVKVYTLVIAVLAQSFAAMIAVVAAHVVAGDRSNVTGAFNRHLRENRSSGLLLGVFRVYKIAWPI